MEGIDKPDIEITDFLGRQLDFEWMDKNQIKLSQIESGLIFIRIKTEEGNFVKKLVIEF
jgi:hypothetical protein